MCFRAYSPFVRGVPSLQSWHISRHHIVLAIRFKVQGDQLLSGPLVSGFSDQGTLFSPSKTAFLKVSTQKMIWKKTLKCCPILITCHQNLLLFCELLQFDHISAGNKTKELNTELSMATICIFIVVMVAILLAFHLVSSSFPQTPCHSSSSSAPAKIRRQRVGDS